jgi:flagellar protein FlgJ
MDEKNPLGSAAAFHFNQHYHQQRLDRVFKSVNPLQAGKSDPKLEAACRDMESLFLTHLLKEMRKTISKSGFISGGRAEEIFTSMLDVELSKRMSEAGGIGLSSLLFQQLGKQSEPEDSPKDE